MKYGYIYKTTNLINGRIYIGQKQGSFMPSYLGSGLILKEAIKKYGKENFILEVLAFASNRGILNALEKKNIFEYRQVFGKAFLYNISDGGEGGSMLGKSSFLGHKHSEETKMKISASAKGKVKPPRTREHALKISEARKGYRHSEEVKKKISLNNIGKHS